MRIKSLQGMRFILFLMLVLFHSSEFINIQNSNFYINILSKLGTFTTSYFFILSAFVETINYSDKKYNLSNIFNKIKKLYICALPFFILSIPFELTSLLDNFKNGIINFNLNLFLLQSWIPNNEYWLGYNSVAWFLSTLIFLKIISKYIFILFNKIKNSIYFYLFIIFCILIQIILCFLVTKNYEYWLYAFPPVRILDYILGICIGKIFMMDKKIRYPKLTEIFLVIIFIIYLILKLPIKDVFTISAIYSPFILLHCYTIAKHNSVFKILNNKKIVEYGNNTLFFILGHQIIMRWVNLFSNKILKISINDWILVIFSICILFIFYYLKKTIKKDRL